MYHSLWLIYDSCFFRLEEDFKPKEKNEFLFKKKKTVDNKKKILGGFGGLKVKGKNLKEEIKIKARPDPTVEQKSKNAAPKPEAEPESNGALAGLFADYGSDSESE